MRARKIITALCALLGVVLVLFLAGAVFLWLPAWLIATGQGWIVLLLAAGLWLVWIATARKQAHR